MAMKRSCGLEFSSCLLLILVTVATFWQHGHASINRKIGIQFLSYANAKGQLSDGTCCDGLSQPNGDCLPDSCDTAFVLCFRHQSNGSNCDPQTETSVIINKNTVSKFGSVFGGEYGNGTRSLLVLPIFTMEDIRIEIDVLEMDNVSSSRQHMGNFSLVVDYTNLFTTHPDWDTYNFDNNVVSLSVNVTSFCANHYFGPKCEINCLPLDSNNFGHFICDNNGSKACRPGWEGANCLQLIDLCVASSCQNGGTCSPILNDITCNCAPGFTGRLCQTVIPTTTTAAPTNFPPPSTTAAATNSPPPTTATTASQSTPASTTTTTTPAAKTPITTPVSSSVTATTISGTTAAASKFANPPPETSDSATNIGLIVGPLVAILLIGALAGVAGYVLWQRKRKRTVLPEEEEGAGKEPSHVVEETKDAQKAWETEEPKPQPPSQENQETLPVPATTVDF